MHRLSVALLAAALAGCGSPPCTDCPAVAGTYRIAIGATQPSDSSCAMYFFHAETVDFPIEQVEATLTSAVSPTESIKGTLHENLYVGFSSFKSEAEDGSPTTNYVSGKFSKTDTGWHFKGTLSVDIDTKLAHGCGATATFEGDRE